MTQRKSKPHLGWKEHIRFPKLSLGPLVAKVDTGARTSALHADEIEVHGKTVRFVIKQNGRRRVYRAPLEDHRHVKSSSGHVEVRPVIRATLQIGQLVFKADITLTNRTDMGYPMLLGRTALKGFLVNPSRSFLFDHAQEIEA